MKPEYKTVLTTTLILLMLVGANSMSSAMRVSEPAPPVRVTAPVAERELIIPVDGVSADRLVDSWGAPRGEGRKHEGIDIMAPAGTPVRAAMAGTIVKLFTSTRGGLTIYEADASGRLILYYAHLTCYAPGLSVGGPVHQGQLIGLVGSTGNATTPHLHFELQHADAQNRWWKGAAFDPFRALKSGTVEDRLTRR